MKRILKYLLICVFLVVAWAGFIIWGTLGGWWHQSITKKTNSESYIAAVEKELNETFVGNFALAVMKDGKVQEEVFHTEGKTVDRNTVFQVASLSKWISAFGVMKLVEEGKLDLDAPVQQYLSRWQLPESDFNNEEVTVRRLLSHTAGLTDGLGYSGFLAGVPVQSLEESLTKASDADEGISGSVQVGVEPGSTFKYSGGGYTLLQLIVEEVSGQSFASYMKEAVLAPLNMTQSSYVWDDSSAYSLAEFYNSDGSKADHYRYTSLAATSLYSSLADLETFFQTFLVGPNQEAIGRNVLKPATIKMMRAPHAKTMGMDIWGLGTILYSPTDDEDYIIGHDGKSTPPINTAVRLNPQTGNGIIILETGNPLLATTLASEWVYWKTGKVDLTLFTMLKDKMVATVGIGWVVIIILSIIVGLIRRKKGT